MSEYVVKVRLQIILQHVFAPPWNIKWVVFNVRADYLLIDTHAKCHKTHMSICKLKEFLVTVIVPAVHTGHEEVPSLRSSNV